MGVASRASGFSAGFLRLVPGLDFKSSGERVATFSAGSIPVPRRHPRSARNLGRRVPLALPSIRAPERENGSDDAAATLVGSEEYDLKSEELDRRIGPKNWTEELDPKN